MPGPQGGSAPRGYLVGGGVVIPPCTEADSPVNRMTDRCKNITFPQLCLRPVISDKHQRKFSFSDSLDLNTT